jgi:signal transduction histidine kinase
VERRNAQVLLAVIVGVALLLIVLSLGTVVLMRRFADELARSQAALQSLNTGLEGAVRARTADLQRANDEIQRFAYIVSHDLRSPLVNVMGFTSELEQSLGALQRQLKQADETRPDTVARDTREAIEQDIPEAIGFIRSSTKKMDRLINAILQLSRQGRRTLTPEPLDMRALAQGVADSLAKLAEQKAAEIVVEPIPSIVSDRLGVEQVLSNLVENAVKYAQPGRPGRVVVRGRESGGRVLLEVEDNGRGIAPQDHERIFELFRRSGSQDTPGEGIGLAHVRALVYRLGGTIACISELGQGATFRVSLPARLDVDQGRAA